MNEREPGNVAGTTKSPRKTSVGLRDKNPADEGFLHDDPVRREILRAEPCELEKRSNASGKDFGTDANRASAAFLGKGKKEKGRLSNYRMI